MCYSIVVRMSIPFEVTTWREEETLIEGNILDTFTVGEFLGEYELGLDLLYPTRICFNMSPSSIK